MKILIQLMAICFLLFACCWDCKQEKEPTQFESKLYKEDSAQFADVSLKLREALKIGLESLDSLSIKQKESIALLVMISSETAGLSPGDHRNNNLKKDIATLINNHFAIPNIITVVDYKNPCLESEIAYATAMAKCEKDGKDERHCPQAWAPAQESLNCAARDVEKKLDRVRLLLRGVGPIPKID